VNLALQPLIDRELEPDEKIVYQAQPDSRLAARGGWVWKIIGGMVFAVAAYFFWTSISLFQVMGSILLNANSSFEKIAATVLILLAFGLVIVPLRVGLWAINMPLHLATDAESTAYVVTDRRALIIVPVGRKFEILKYDRNQIQNFELSERFDGSGTIRFVLNRSVHIPPIKALIAVLEESGSGTPVRFVALRPSVRFIEIGFTDIPNVREAERALRVMN
jgi:hypothetical protein